MYQSLLTTAAELSLVDLSPLPRAGIKGSDLSSWIEWKSYEIGEESNRAYAQRDRVLIARLSAGELMLLSDPADPSMDAMSFSLEMSYSCYPVRRQDSHYWFALTGSRSPAMFAKLCGVDLSPDIFANHSVAQTSVAKTSAIIVRHDVEDALCYYLLGDSSTVLYMRNCLIDAVKEYDGQMLDLQTLMNSEDES